ncbi:MAG: DUF4221 domain-containing protein [Bacteroidales bacterium]|jgi:hypothetical protein|nr:DUF4221 domain-containing protein [Bacteroidales bacterium]
MKLSYVCTYVKAGVIRLCFGIIFAFLFCSCSALGQKGETLRITPCDTIELPLKIQYVQSFYMPEYNTQANTYFVYYPETYRHGFALCLDSIKPTALFPVNTLIENYLIEDTNTFIYQPSRSNLSQNKFLKRVNSKGTILDTLYFGFMGAMYGDTLVLSSLGTLAFPLQKTEAKRHYYAHTHLTKIIYHLSDFETRCKLLQHPLIQGIIVSKDSVISAQANYVHYPKNYFSEKTFYSNWWPRVAINKNLDIVTSYFFIDSLFVTHPEDNSQEHFPMKSRHKTKPTETFNPQLNNDPIYRKQYASRTVSYIYLHYDSYRDYYYEVATIPTPYENKDGTFNDPKDKPWSLIVMDGSYQQIAEIDMPNYLSKHDIMITAQGIAIQNKILSDEKGTPVYVIYKLEKQ